MPAGQPFDGVAEGAAEEDVDELTAPLESLLVEELAGAEELA